MKRSTQLLPHLRYTRSNLSHTLSRRNIYTETQHDDSSKPDPQSTTLQPDYTPSVPYHLQRRSTITQRERLAFRSLFYNVLSYTRKPPKPKPPAEQSQHPQNNAVAADGSDTSNVLRHATPGEASGGTPSVGAATPLTSIPSRMPRDLRAMAAGALNQVAQEASLDRARQELDQLRRRRGAQAEAVPPGLYDYGIPESVRREQEEQHDRIESLLSGTKTDAELWRVLEREVFSVVRALGLDGPVTTSVADEVGTEEPDDASTSEQHPPQQDPPPTQGPEITSIDDRDAQRYHLLKIFGPNYPSLLILAMRQLRHTFPHSPLPFSILPAIKRLGRGSYMLGASTALYNELIAATWLTYGDFTTIDGLLREMLNSGLEFDGNTLDLVKEIRAAGKRDLAGEEGEVRRVVAETEGVRRGWTKVVRWVGVVGRKLEEDERRKAVECQYDIGVGT